jgi:hypothetical protein
MLERIADGKLKGVRISDRINAIRVMGMFGLGIGSAVLDERLRANSVPREVRFVFVESKKVKRVQENE